MIKPIAHTIKEACTVSRTGKTTLYSAIRRKELVARKLGKKTLILEDDRGAGSNSCRRSPTSNKKISPGEVLQHFAGAHRKPQPEKKG